MPVSAMITEGAIAYCSQTTYPIQSI